MAAPSIANKTGICDRPGQSIRMIRTVTAAAAYLETLNIEQRRAVEHGVVDAKAMIAAPLLIIAGAGSGKTNTLAHRVAHLIVGGADPRRILLMTFSRRAAAEMSRRVTASAIINVEMDFCFRHADALLFHSIRNLRERRVLV